MFTVPQIQNAALILLITYLIVQYYRQCQQENFENEQKQRFARSGATYRVTFSTNWDPNHPESGLRIHFRAPRPQFRALVGVTHRATNRIWAPGQYALAGVYNYLKDGGTDAFEKEATKQIQIREAEFLIKSDPLIIQETKEDEDKTHQVTTTFKITKDFPLVSILTRMVPSPDYFLGIAGQSLLDQDGQFVGSLSVPLVLYDAGYNKKNFTEQNRPNLPSDILNPKDVIKPVLIGNQRKYLHHNGILRFEKIEG